MNPRLSERPESFTINGIAFPPFREALFWAKVDASADCWVWTAGRYRSGYGSFSLGNKIGGYYTHRIAWELMVGPIPEGLHIDHRCRNRTCCNPDHLEPVTPAENTRRSTAPLYRSRWTHCKHGHEYTPENTRLRLRRDGTERVCRTCMRQWNSEYHQRKRAARERDELGGLQFQ